MYYLPDPGSNRVSFVYKHKKFVMVCASGLLNADISIGSRQPRIDNRLQCSVLNRPEWIRQEIPCL